MNPPGAPPGPAGARRFGWIAGLVLLVVGLVVAPFAGLFAWGLILDPAYESTVSATIAAPPEVLARSLAEPAEQERWRPGATTVTILDPVDGKPRIRVVAGETKIELERTLAEPTQVVWEVIPSQKHVFEGSWTWTLAPVGAGTRVTLIERGVIMSPFARAAAESLFGLDRWSRASLKRLGHVHQAEVVFEGS
jgi:uncharacterized protein YndB with AHSA1/START domain